MDEPRDRIRKLILAGDNRLKQGHDERARERARESFEQALALARDNGLEESVQPLIEARLADLEQEK